MKIETKFNLRDIVWFMKDNKATVATISSVKIFQCGTNQDNIQYTAEKLNNSVSWRDYEHLQEDDLFSKKEDLLSAL